MIKPHRSFDCVARTSLSSWGEAELPSLLQLESELVKGQQLSLLTRLPYWYPSTNFPRSVLMNDRSTAFMSFWDDILLWAYVLTMGLAPRLDSISPGAEIFVTVNAFTAKPKYRPHAVRMLKSIEDRHDGYYTATADWAKICPEALVLCGDGLKKAELFDVSEFWFTISNLRIDQEEVKLEYGTGR